jgi:cob(I)alamin adenosyltransferase
LTVWFFTVNPADMSDAEQQGGYGDPKLAINRVYTRKGDDGRTALVGGQRVSKSDARIEAYGTVDELGACVGWARALLRDGEQPLAGVLLRVQHELFNLGSILATLPEDVHPRQPRVGEADVKALEEDIDRLNADLPALRSFVLAGDCDVNGALHLARCVCRRAERRLLTLIEQLGEDASDGERDALRYLNRLSDALFVFSRWASKARGSQETLWQPNAAASGQ